MTETTATVPARLRGSRVSSVLARQEIKRYARHPLFLVGLAFVVFSMMLPPDKHDSSLMRVLAPAAGLGVMGLLVMASLVRASDRAAEAAGAVATSERTRTLALTCAAAVPFAAGLVWFGWAVWAYHYVPPKPYTAPFGGVGDGWVYGMLFALGPMAAAGGPILGLVVGRWLRYRGAAPVSAVVLVLVTILLQGVIEPIRYGRVVAPWTYFAGPIGIKGDSERWLILTGSPGWYCLYLAALCAIGVLVAVLHDREQRNATVVKILGGVGVLAIVLCAFAMTTGVQEVLVNPLSPPL